MLTFVPDGGLLVRPLLLGATAVVVFHKTADTNALMPWDVILGNILQILQLFLSSTENDICSL